MTALVFERGFHDSLFSISWRLCLFSEFGMTFGQMSSAIWRTCAHSPGRRTSINLYGARVSRSCSYNCNAEIWGTSSSGSPAACQRVNHHGDIQQPSLARRAPTELELLRRAQHPQHQDDGRFQSQQRSGPGGILPLSAMWIEPGMCRRQSPRANASQ